MNMLGSVLGKSSDISLALAEAFFKSVPANGKRRLNETEWSASLEKFHRSAKEIRQEHGLGPLARALVTYHFQKRLFQAGLSDEVVRKVVFSLVINAFVSNQ